MDALLTLLLMLSTQMKEGIESFNKKNYDKAILSFTKVIDTKSLENRYKDLAYYYRGQSYHHKQEKAKSLGDLLSVFNMTQNMVLKKSCQKLFKEWGGDIKKLEPALGPKATWAAFYKAAVANDAKTALAFVAPDSKWMAEVNKMTRRSRLSRISRENIVLLSEGKKGELAFVMLKFDSEKIKMWLIRDKKENKWLLSHLDEAAEARRTIRKNNMGNLKQLLLGCLMYSGDKNGHFPGKLKELKEQEIISKETLFQYHIANKKSVNYMYIPGYRDDNSMATTNIIVFSPVVENGKRLCGFIDGHVELLDEKEFIKRAKSQNIKVIGGEIVKLSKAEIAQIEALIKDLGNESFKKRKAAKEALQKIGWKARKILEKHKNSKDIEIRSIIVEILKGN
ncbi:MAG: hypothetical protein HRT89_05450 [Lentisphaeria bacterium]|nr:hypothetical protein [Lentisphaeria bacterium]NQZ67497.1 hypothetical protein [Lentisphaeria bacterium]